MQIGKPSEIITNVDLVIGTRITLRRPKAKQEAEGRVVGFKTERYMLVRADGFKAGFLGRKKGLEVELNYFHGGAIYWCRTKILAELAKPVPLLMLDYPQEFTRRSFRSKPRIDLCLPGSIVIKSTSFQGVIVNLSASGCVLTCRHDPDGVVAWAETNSEVLVTFGPDPEKVPVFMPATIRRKVDYPGFSRFILIFRSAGLTDGVAAIEEFIETAAEFRVDYVTFNDHGPVPPLD